MRTNLAVYSKYQVFLNYPFDAEFEKLANAMHFGVVAAGLLPVCAKDLSTPDRPRLEILVEAITSCHYSAHDLSRCRGEGVDNFARFNMPIEMGMALFYALHTQRNVHRCAFVVPKPHDYQAFASDLAGLDPRYYDKNDVSLAVSVYEWLRDVVKEPLLNRKPTAKVKEKYIEFRTRLKQIKGSGRKNSPNHDEAQELMYSICSACRWWDWRGNKAGKLEFPRLELSWKSRSKQAASFRSNNHKSRS